MTSRRAGAWGPCPRLLAPRPRFSSPPPPPLIPAPKLRRPRAPSWPPTHPRSLFPGAPSRVPSIHDPRSQIPQLLSPIPGPPHPGSPSPGTPSLAPPSQAPSSPVAPNLRPPSPRPLSGPRPHPRARPRPTCRPPSHSLCSDAGKPVSAARRRFTSRTVQDAGTATVLQPAQPGSTVTRSHLREGKASAGATRGRGPRRRALTCRPWRVLTAVATAPSPCSPPPAPPGPAPPADRSRGRKPRPGRGPGGAARGYAPARTVS